VPDRTEVPPPLPSGFVLAPGEQLVANESFKRSLIVVWLRSNLALTNRRLTGRSANLALGVIPTGSRALEYPLETISTVDVSSSFSAMMFVVGLLLASFVIGIIWMVAAFQTRLTITTTAGQRIDVGVTPLERSRARSFAKQVNATIAGR
jgi:hypothetical protein